MVLILLNSIVLAMGWDQMPHLVEKILDGCNMVFTVIFTVECILKIIVFKIKNYFADPWNVFDFIVVLGSLVDIVMSFALVSYLYLLIYIYIFFYA